MNKYKLIEEKGTHLKRIMAPRDIPELGVNEGDLGGLIESEHNLSQIGKAWAFGDARVFW